MATRPADRQRSVLIGIAIAALALSGLAVRAIKAATTTAATPLPTADIQSLSTFLAPLPDTTALAHLSSSTMVVTRDPFAPSSSVAQVRGTRGTAAEASNPTTGAGQLWVVSSILFEGTKRSAIVNNAWVTIGDALGGGSRLTAVERDHVVVTDAKGNRHIVSIQGGEK